MSEPISWDPSLVKKFSSSNHYKLLNQLRNEVKKYPLNNKKKESSVHSRDPNLDKNINSNVPHIINNSITNNTNKSNENNNKSTVSFNNAKNFSIYNQTNNHKNNDQMDGIIIDEQKSSENSYSASFKERLNQIDMK